MNIPNFKEHPGGKFLLDVARSQTDSEKQMLFLSYHIGCNWKRIKHYCNHFNIRGTCPGSVVTAYKTSPCTQPEASRSSHIPASQTQKRHLLTLFEHERENDTIYKELDAIIREIKRKYWLDDYVNLFYCVLCLICMPLAFLVFILWPCYLTTFNCIYWNFAYGAAIFHPQYHGYQMFKVFKHSQQYQLIQKLQKTLKYLGIKKNITKMNITNMIDKCALFAFKQCEFYSQTVGISGKIWSWRHNVSHHVWTNAYEQDYDIKSTFLLKRAIVEPSDLYINPLGTTHLKYQHIYVPILFCLFPIVVTFDNAFVHGTSKRYFMFTVLSFWIIPMLMHGFFNYLYYLILFYIMHGLSAGFSFEVSHNHSNIVQSKQFSIELPMNNIDLWIKNQIEASISYKHFIKFGNKSIDEWIKYFTCMYYGGLNLQIEHHIAPALNPLHYYRLQPYLIKLCQKYGIIYTYEETFFDAVTEYLHFLKYAGNRD